MVPWLPPTKPPAVPLSPTVTVLRPGTASRRNSCRSMSAVVPGEAARVVVAGDVAEREAAGDRAAVVSGESAGVALMAGRVVPSSDIAESRTSRRSCRRYRRRSRRCRTRRRSRCRWRRRLLIVPVAPVEADEPAGRSCRPTRPLPAAPPSRDRAVVGADEAAGGALRAGGHVAGRERRVDRAGRRRCSPTRPPMLPALKMSVLLPPRDIAGRDIETADRAEIESDKSAGAAAGRVRNVHIAARAGEERRVIVAPVAR